MPLPEPDNQTAVENFPRLEPLLLLLFSLATFGVYVPYWLYTRTVILNKLCADKPIPSSFISLCIAGFVVMIGLIFTLPEASSVEELKNSQHYSAVLTVALLINLLLLCWGFLFCQRLNHYTQVPAKNALHASFWYLFLVHIFVVNILYLQYKINQIIDSRRPGLM